MPRQSSNVTSALDEIPSKVKHRVKVVDIETGVQVVYLTFADSRVVGSVWKQEPWILDKISPKYSTIFRLLQTRKTIITELSIDDGASWHDQKYKCKPIIDGILFEPEGGNSEQDPADN